MRKKDLQDLRILKTEIRLLTTELKSISTTKDSVKGSMAEFPYLPVTVRVEGVDVTENTSLQLKLEAKLEKLQEKLAEMEDWLDSVEDPEMRIILRLRYRNGLSWQRIAFEIGAYDEQLPRKKEKKFWSRYEKYETKAL